MVQIASVKARVAEIKKSLWVKTRDGSRQAQNVSAAIQSSISILSLIYGEHSAQLQQFLDRIKRKTELDLVEWRHQARVAEEIESVLESTSRSNVSSAGPLGVKNDGLSRH